MTGCPLNRAESTWHSSISIFNVTPFTLPSLGIAASSFPIAAPIRCTPCGWSNRRCVSFRHLDSSCVYATNIWDDSTGGPSAVTTAWRVVRINWGMGARSSVAISVVPGVIVLGQDVILRVYIYVVIFDTMATFIVNYNSRSA